MSFINKHIFRLYGILFSTVLCLFIARLSYHFEQDRIKRVVIENLQLNHQLSISSITRNLRALGQEITLLAQNNRIQNIINSPKDQFQGSEFDLWASKTVNYFGYHDLFIINAKGDIIYSVAKEKDLGTNLKTGRYRTSGLGNIFRQVNDSTSLMVSDFSVYEPSGNSLAGFIGAPILNNNKLVGIICVQLPTSFEKLNIGVHIDEIVDYIITTNYIFDVKNEFEPLDSAGFLVPKESPLFKEDSLFLITAFNAGSLEWGILSIAPPQVFEHKIRWPTIWYHIILTFLVSQIIVILVIYKSKNKWKGSTYSTNEVLIVQNTWQQFNKKEHSFGTDFYYRVKNKTTLELVGTKEEVLLFGDKIEEQILIIVSALSDEEKLYSALIDLMKVCKSYNITVSKILKIPTLFVESYEDEFGKELPIRAKLAWQKVLKALGFRVIKLLKKANQ